MSVHIQLYHSAHAFQGSWEKWLHTAVTYPMLLELMGLKDYSKGFGVA